MCGLMGNGLHGMVSHPGRSPTNLQRTCELISYFILCDGAEHTLAESNAGA